MKGLMDEGNKEMADSYDGKLEEVRSDDKVHVCHARVRERETDVPAAPCCI